MDKVIDMILEIMSLRINCVKEGRMKNANIAPSNNIQDEDTLLALAKVFQMESVHTLRSLTRNRQYQIQKQMLEDNLRAMALEEKHLPIETVRQIQPLGHSSERREQAQNLHGERIEAIFSSAFAHIPR